MSLEVSDLIFFSHLNASKVFLEMELFAVNLAILMFCYNIPDPSDIFHGQLSLVSRT
jgi:hypothetical protein